MMRVGKNNKFMPSRASSGEEPTNISNSLQYYCLGNPMERGAWRATVHGVAESRTQQSNFHHHTEMEDGTSGLLGGSWTQFSDRWSLRCL